MRKTSTERVLLYTMMAIAVIATYVTVNSYYTQLEIYQEKELFKLDCIANAVAYKISGEEHSLLKEKYPNSDDYRQLQDDSIYKKIFEQMYMAKVMTKVPSEMFTIIREPGEDKIYQAISTDDHNWLVELHGDKRHADSLYEKGGMIGLYEAADGKRLGAISPVMSSRGEVVGMLQVEETFDSFFAKAKDQIYYNIFISLIFVAIIGVLMFLSVKNILKRQEKLANEKAELEVFRKELLANVSHDLRTPLAGIHGYIETLIMKKDELDQATREKYLNVTLQGTERLKNLVDELFELSKLESKQTRAQIEPFSIQDLSNDIANQYKAQLAEKSIEISVDSPSSIPVVKGDVALIDRVIQNLVTNSIKHCTAGDRISILIKEDEGNVWVTVADTGSGISAEDLPHLFDRFYKGSSRAAGTGLGLAIVKHILDLHGSTFKVDSKQNEGTKFVFSLNI